MENSSDKYELTNVEASKKLYAKFKVDTYTVEAYAQHGNNVPSGDAGKVSFDNDNNNYASKVTTTVNRNGEVTFYAKPESGYAFIGWYETKDAADPKVTVENCAFDKDNGVYSTKMTIQYSDVKTYALYARFKALYTVDARAMYNNENVYTAGTVQVGNEQAGKTSNAPVMEGENVTVKASHKSGYKFAGWYKNEACNEPYFSENNNASSITLKNVNKPITLYAKFESDLTTIYFYNSNGWENVYAYVWGDGNNNNNKGSDEKFGKPMTCSGGKVWEYSYSSSESWKNVIFSNGNTGNGNQTGDIPLDQGKRYYKNGWQPISDIKHTVTVLNVENADITVTADSDTIAEGASRVVYDGTSLTLNASNVVSGYYCNFIVTPSSGTASTLTTNPSNYTIDGSDITVSATFSSSSTVKTFYFENTLNWDEVSLYCYKSGSGDVDGYDKWPGNVLTTKYPQKRHNHDVYCIEIDTSKVDTVIFNNNKKKNGLQSQDIKLNWFVENNANGCSFKNDNGNYKVDSYFTIP